uniref:Uncharacterized protein n=1 Tax=Glossina morsitans morsitans TaxID=37546 RepID=A0ABK9NFY9_GLOMM
MCQLLYSNLSICALLDMQSKYFERSESLGNYKTESWHEP